MGRFIVTLSDDHRVKLEAYRKAHGLRSEAEAVRHIIDAWRIESMMFGSAAIKISDDGFVERVDASVLENAEQPRQRDFAPNATITVKNRDGRPARFQDVDVAHGETVTFGPIKRAPGSRLKKPKGEK